MTRSLHSPACTTSCSVLNPEVIVLGGGVVEALGEEIIGLIDDSIRKTAFEYSFRGVRVVKASLGDDAGITGAAILARERVSSSQPSL